MCENVTYGMIPTLCDILEKEKPIDMVKDQWLPERDEQMGHRRFLGQ